MAEREREKKKKNDAVTRGEEREAKQTLVQACLVS